MLRDQGNVNVSWLGLGWTRYVVVDLFQLQFPHIANQICSLMCFKNGSAIHKHNDNDSLMITVFLLQRHQVIHSVLGHYGKKRHYNKRNSHSSVSCDCTTPQIYCFSLFTQLSLLVS